MMARKPVVYSVEETDLVVQACRLILAERIDGGIAQMRVAQAAIHAAIPQKLRIGRGITWVLQRMSRMIYASITDEPERQAIRTALVEHIRMDDLLIGLPLFLMCEHGKSDPEAVLPFFERAASSPDWIAREFAAGAFREVISVQRQNVIPWLMAMAQREDANQRRLVAESLRPVTILKWVRKAPEFSLQVLRLMFAESAPYPRTAVGNNLSDLSTPQPELIFEIVGNLVASGNPNSYWIAHRACRNLVKKNPTRVLDVLKLDRYVYKDRDFSR